MVSEDEDTWLGYDCHEEESTPPHPFTPDVVAWARAASRERARLMRLGLTDVVPPSVKAARQILAAVGEG